MTSLLAVLGGVAALLAVLAVVAFVMSRSVVRGNAERAALVLGEPAPGDLQQSAAVLQPEDRRGIGVLRLTSDELLFASGDGEEVTRIARADIDRAGSSHDLDGLTRPLKRPALIIRTRDGDMIAFAVSEVSEWTDRMATGPRPS